MAASSRKTCARGVAVRACDVRFDDAALRAHAASHGVALHASHAVLAHEADLVVSAVTASQAVTVAEACAPGLRKGAFFLDFNSASPGAKQRAAQWIDGAGGRYVEGAVMTSVPPHRMRVPLLLGGPHAHDLLPLLEGLGFAPKLASDRVGVASAVKMCRSVMIKGMEALVIESFTAARAYGVEDAVLASLAETFPGIDWERQGTYFFQRVIEHGRRRAEEMREVAVTVADTGLDPIAAAATAVCQDWVADLAAQDTFARGADWRVEADRILAHLTQE